MSSATGLPYNVIAAQANTESGFNATAQSSAGAEGWLQFLPSTYDANAARAGVGPGTEFNPADEAKVYDVYMSGLLKQEGGDVKKALAAYNAGPGNLTAGYPYAEKILGESGQAGNITTTGFSVPGAISGALGGAAGGGLSISGILGSVLGDMRDSFERLGLILLGAALILLGIHILSGGSGGGGTVTNVTEQAAGAAAPARGKHAKGATAGTGASEAVEAAAEA
jgi:transglycosylase-like protein with SLT domain